MTITNILHRKFHKSKNKINKYVPTILSYFSVFGVIGTTILAVKSTPKAIDLMKKDSMTNHDGDPNASTKLEAIKSCWKCYIPTAVLGLATISCIAGTNMINYKNQASLASAYALLNQSYKRYRQSAKEVYGDGADRKIMSEMAEEIYISDGFGNSYRPDLDNADKTLFFDNHSMRYFQTTMAAVINAEYHVNRNLQLRGDVCLNEFYDFLGIEQIEGGNEIGWNMDNIFEGGFGWLDFNNDFNKLEDGLEYFQIYAVLEPERLDSDDE